MNNLIRFLDRKLKIRDFMEPEDQPVMMTLDDLFKIIMTVDGVDETLATKIMDKVYDMMGGTNMGGD